MSSPNTGETVETEALTVPDAEAGETTTASGSTEAVTHEVTLFAEPIANVAGVPITNSLATSWVVVLLLVVASVAIRRRLKRVPTGFQNVVEMVVEGAMKLADSVTGDRRKTERILPFVFPLFLFILLNNWIGLFPGIGSIGWLEQTGRSETFVPFFRGGTADLNTTLALALFAVLASNVFGIVAVGAWRHLNKFINISALARIPAAVRQQPTVLFINPVKFFVGIIEVIGEVAKVASLSFRLFGNIFAGEVLLSSMAIIFAFLVPIPFIFLEVVIGIIQALIFAMLTLVYFTIASTAEEH